MKSWFTHLLVVAFLCPLCLAGEKPAAPKAAPAQPAVLAPFDKASWIWSAGADDTIYLRKVLILEEAPTAAHILITADNGYNLFINGSSIGSKLGMEAEIWQSVERFDLKPQLAMGRNILGICGMDLGPPAGVVAALRLEFKQHPPLELVTDASWRVSTKADPAKFAHPDYIEGADWQNARVIGPMGVGPWGSLAFSAEAAANRPPPPKMEVPVPGKDFRWPQAIAFLADDCSVYVPLRGEAWGVCFRVGDWSRAYTEFDLPCPSKIGRKLFSLSFPPSPAATDSPAPNDGKPASLAPEPKLLCDAGTGCMGSPSVAFDGKTIYVAMALGQEQEKFFHIYRIPAEGGAPKRLTDGPFHDLDPVELPDGRIAFASTRTGTFEEYHNPPSRALFVMNPDGTAIHPITSTIIFDNEPKVTADGRLAFIRTDNFFDRGKVETQIHVVRPDGTDGLTEIGASSGAEYGGRLRAYGYGSPAPLPDGRLAVISSRGNFISSMGVSEGQVQRLPGNLGDIAPMPDGRLLCTILRRQMRGMASDVIAVFDPRDNQMIRIYESAAGGVHSPVFLGPRARPPVIPESVERRRADGPAPTGFLMCQNVRFTTKTNADWAQVRAIRVLKAAGLTTRSSHSHIVHAGHQAVELGVVPLAPDGSFFVEVPADVPLALQAVDAEGRSELNEMSWIYVRPGERRSCVGCHHQRQAAPRIPEHYALAASIPPLRLLGQGNPPSFRGNNSGVTGMMDLQFERFRESASINRHSGGPLTTGQQEVAALAEQLRSAPEATKLTAIQRLSIFRDRAAAPALAERLQDQSREVRVAAAMALAACGTRESAPALLKALTAPDPLLAQAAATALECLTGHAEAFNSFAPVEKRESQAANWRRLLEPNGSAGVPPASASWDAIEQKLVAQALPQSPAVAGKGKAEVPNPAAKRHAILALGHIGGAAGREALRKFVTEEKTKSPYPPFTGDNRTDSFTFNAASPYNPRTLQAAVRALGHLKDTQAVPLLSEILAQNIEPKTANLFLAEAAIEALGRIATPEAETALLETFGKLKEYWQYVGWYSDHPALYACHSCPLHFRIAEALDATGSTRTAAIVPNLIRSVPTDPDRALFPENDDYENVVGRVIRRSGRGEEAIETCLALLGDTQAKAAAELKTAISTTAAAWGGHPGPENRAAQILSLLCRDSKYEPRVRAAFELFRAKPEEPVKRSLGNPSWTPIRHWTLFYLARALGNLGDKRSVDVLLAILGPELNEARHGRPDPAQPVIHFLQLEYTPCWRAAAAYALGCIADKRAVPTLLNAAGNLDNATDVRHAAAIALGRIGDPASFEAIRKLAQDYPEVSTRRALLQACEPLNAVVEARLEK